MAVKLNSPRFYHATNENACVSLQSDTLEKNNQEQAYPALNESGHLLAMNV